MTLLRSCEEPREAGSSRSATGFWLSGTPAGLSAHPLTIVSVSLQQSANSMHYLLYPNRSVTEILDECEQIVLIILYNIN